MIDDGNAPAKLIRFFHVMRRQENCLALGIEFSQQVPHRPPRLRIESRGWFIKKENRRIMH